MNKLQVAKQQRIENILSSLKKMDYMTRRQLQTIHRLGGDRNANRILNDMSEYLQSFRFGLENVYYLSKAGRERIKSRIIRRKTPNIQHFLLRNQLWIHLGCPYTWRNEIRIKNKDTNEIIVICDAMFQQKGTAFYVEVDVSQPMTKNSAKIERYKRLKEQLNHDFTLIFVTELENRRAKLIRLMGDLKHRVYTANEIY